MKGKKNFWCILIYHLRTEAAIYKRFLQLQVTNLNIKKAFKETNICCLL